MKKHLKDSWIFGDENCPVGSLGTRQFPGLVLFPAHLNFVDG